MLNKPIKSKIKSFIEIKINNFFPYSYLSRKSKTQFWPAKEIKDKFSCFLYYKWLMNIH
ncbi:hypothetical protein DB42_BS00130 [Neochlamydia sp. EPS4]|nr:hypothetical protein DB42_BS00130 [Neochlamydia sp. EPS4]